VVIRPYIGLDPRYLAYYINGAAQGFVASRLVGAVQQHFNVGSAREIDLPDVSIHEQQAVARLLGSLDDKIAINERILTSALELAKCRYQAYVHASETVAVGTIADVFDGPHATPVKVSEGPWFLSISSLHDGLLDLDESAHVSEEDFVKWTRRVTPQVSDVLFSYETKLGSAALMPGRLRACLGRRMALLRPREGQVGSATLLHAYLSEQFQETIARRAIHGATVDRIPLTELPSWPIVLPRRDHCDQVESVLGVLHRRIEASQRENRVLAELRDTLLPKLMSGELRIRDVERQVEEVT
jgi:type I restriction enzyme S subunit